MADIQGGARVKMQWVEELPGRPAQPRRGFNQPQERSRDLHEHAAQLVRYPMRWAVFPRHLSARYARGVVSNINEGGLAAYSPDLGFEAALRQGVIYVRHNPARVNPSRVSFHEGYRAGVRDTVEKVRSGVFTLRQFLARIEEENRAAVCDA